MGEGPAGNGGAAAPDDVSDRIIDAALAEFADHGLRRVSMADVARRAGVHRVTVHKRFAGRDHLMTIAAITWADRIFRRIANAVADLPTVEESLVEGFVMAVREIRADPIVVRGLAVEPETFLPILTTRGGPTIAAVSGFFAEQIRAADATLPDTVDIDGAAEVAARIGLSFLLTPDSHFDIDDEDAVRAFARRYLVPLLNG